MLSKYVELLEILRAKDPLQHADLHHLKASVKEDTELYASSMATSVNKASVVYLLI